MSFLRPQVSHVIEAETLWASFVVKHNLAFNASDHATKLFPKMFPNSEVAKKFACGHTKTDVSKLSIMMDESKLQ